MNNRIKGLIDIANEQIEILEEIQFEDALENNAVEVSREIRNWCEFIRVLEFKEKTAQEEQVQEQSICINLEVSIDKDLLQEKLSNIKNFVNKELNSISDVIKIK